jgi:hypothetical protein
MHVDVFQLEFICLPTLGVPTIHTPEVLIAVRIVTVHCLLEIRTAGFIDTLSSLYHTK